jgi:thioredoxin-related protein
MKKIFSLLITILVSMTVEAQGVNFQELTLNQALAKAKAEQKFVFVDVYTDWCGPCRMMATQIFPMKEMGDYFNPKYVSIKLNAEKGEEGPAFKNKYGIRAYPTFVILDSEGNLLHMFAGGVLNLSFIDKVEESFNPDLAFGNLQQRYQAGERDKKLVASYLKALKGTYTVDVTPMVNDFVTSLGYDELICSDCLFIFDEFAPLGSPREKFFTDNIEKFRDVIGRDTVDKVLKNKYITYYAGILGKQRTLNPQEFEQNNNKLKKLQITKGEILPLYQETINATTSKTDVEKLYKHIIKLIPSTDKVERDTYLYFTIPAIGTSLTKEQVDNLVSMIENESTRNTIIKNLERSKATKKD